MKTLKYLNIALAVLAVSFVSCEKQGADPGTEAPVLVQLDPHPADITITYVDDVDFIVKVNDINGGKVSTQVDVEVQNNEGYTAGLTSVSVSNGEGILSTDGSELKQVAKASEKLDLTVASLHVLANVDGITMRWPFDMNVVSSISEMDAPTQAAAGSTIEFNYGGNTYMNAISEMELLSKTNFSGDYMSLVTHQNIHALAYNDSIEVNMPAAGDTLYLRINLTADNTLSDSREIFVKAIEGE
ncbi:MAG: hypothetical protein PVF73_01105 [Bacteroidales bacterium]|jgi:hypothetical protein